jgi:glyoxylase-like metal-dependent hydrolase (beta-lactamase superfamily II)
MIHFLNCFTCKARMPRSWQTGALCLLIETEQGLVLVDSGLGMEDYSNPPAILRAFKIPMIAPLNPGEAALRQVERLGYQPEDVRHIVLTHMHFDHAGGLSDFHHATVHVHHREYEAFCGLPRRVTDLAYVRRHTAHSHKIVLCGETGETWFDFPAIRLPFDPEMWLVPLFGHTRGHCGVAVQTEEGWLFHVGSAAPTGLDENRAPWFIKLIMGPHAKRLLAFKAAHPEIRMTTGHEWLDFFEG